MAKKTFALNTEPHVADVGGTELLFLPEVMGDEFLDAYQEMRESHMRDKGVDVAGLEGSDVESLRAVASGLRTFLSRLMLPESAALITRVDVLKSGKVLESCEDWDEAARHAGEVPGAAAKWGLRLPDRVLLMLLEWVIELYAGGKRPPTSSGASARPSPKGGKRGMAPSRSKASAPTTGP
ncbi:hypothetical protein ABT358_02540 [Streptomyces sp. NPDC000341]|uniref:hypothetical protein n=1 Tax=Streptomyces sp. NPDC000341 TaxID=3156645 RepID=UPI003333AF2D